MARSESEPPAATNVIQNRYWQAYCQHQLTKNMKIILIFIVLTLVSCIGPEYKGPPKSSTIAEENEVLLNRYRPDRKRIKINDKNYEIVDSWTSFNLPERFTGKVHKKMYNFFIVLKDLETGSISTSYEFELPRNYIKYSGVEYGYGIGLSDLSGMLALDYLTEKKSTAEDTLSFTLINKEGEQMLHFYKE